MNWNQFLMCLGGVYLFYYLANVLLDFVRGRTALTEETGQLELYFTEPSAPKKVSLMQEALAARDEVNVVPSERTEKPTHVMQSGKPDFTGGVSLKELFALAQADLIEYTRDIAY